MNRFKWGLFCCIFITSFSKCFSQNQSPQSDDLTELVSTNLLLDSLLKDYQKSNNLPGAIIGIKQFNQQESIQSVGYSDLKNYIQMNDSIQFRCGSITKLFTAIVVLQMVEEGKLGLDYTVTSILPELKPLIKNAEFITIRQLLNHTSGLGHPTEDNWKYRFRMVFQPKYFYKSDFHKRLNKYIYYKPLKHFPGTNQYYSNAGYWILAKVVEHIEGENIEQVLSKRICKPLDLQHTYLSKKNDEKVAKGYTRIGKKFKDVTKWDGADCDGDPAAGLISTASDLLKFGEALFNEQLISDSTLTDMLTINELQVCSPNCEYGLGLETWNTPLFNGYGKNGSSLGVDANLICFPEQQKIIVIFTNSGGGSDKGFMNGLLLE
jgi:D-alanyl-D-alanine carboxypeptidase